MGKLPKSRNKNIIVQNVEGDELLIYDLSTDKVFCLNQTSARVYNACDGETTFAELKGKYDFTGDLIFFTLDELRKEKLLDEKTDYVSSLAGVSRREAIRQVGLATAVALPLISSIAAPQAAEAQSVEVAGACVIGKCYPAGTDYCAGGCANMSITFTVFDSMDGSCMNNEALSPNYQCGFDPILSGNDFIISAVN